MQNNQQTKNKKEMALRQIGVARTNLLLMVILTAVNIVLFAVGTNTMLLFSATVPYFAAVFGMASGITELYVMGIMAAAVIILIYFLCWLLSKKHYGWMIAALALFAVDTIVMGLFYILTKDFSGILDVLIHLWVLYYLIMGVVNGHKLNNLTPEEEAEYEISQRTAVEMLANENCEAIRPADTEVKARMLIEGDYVGHHIAFRRVKRVNELVIDGYVYDDVEMLVETAHTLNASVDGHSIQAGFDGANRCYIIIDGEQVAKKLRLI